MFQSVTRKCWGSILMVAGTAIGAGMLALPIVTSEIGFFYAALLFVLCYAFMMVNSFLLVEASCYSQKADANIITISGEHLGALGQIVAWVCFLLLLYAVAAAYISAGGALVGHFLQEVLGPQVSLHWGMFIFIVGFALIVLFGMRSTDLINRILLVGLVAAFLYLFSNMAPHVNTDYFVTGEASYIWAAIPVIILSFTSNIIIPSLKKYLDNDTKKLARALLIGGVIPLVFYLLWQFIILGVLPMYGPHGLIAIEHSAYPVNALTQTLESYFGLASAAIAVGIFSFCALTTSFLAVLVSLVDFLADGLRINHITKFGKKIYLVIAVIPPLLFALFFPKGFLVALGYGGVFVAILYGILPALMVWKARYQKNLKSEMKVFGGKPLLCIVLLASIAIIFFQVGATLGWIPV
ncbi:MAG: aromatic amino acid transport family protein [Legionellales bacterium]|jgi:tyrosine-specific transport protein